MYPSGHASSSSSSRSSPALSRTTLLPVCKETVTWQDVAEVLPTKPNLGEVKDLSVLEPVNVDSDQSESQSEATDTSSEATTIVEIVKEGSC